MRGGGSIPLVRAAINGKSEESEGYWSQFKISSISNKERDILCTDALGPMWGIDTKALSADVY